MTKLKICIANFCSQLVQYYKVQVLNEVDLKLVQEEQGSNRAL